MKVYLVPDRDWETVTTLLKTIQLHRLSIPEINLTTDVTTVEAIVSLIMETWKTVIM